METPHPPRPQHSMIDAYELNNVLKMYMNNHKPGWVRRVVRTIWNVGAGDPGSFSVRNANSGKPLKVD